MEGYKFVPSPYCGCFKPEDVPKTEPLSTQSANNIPASLPSVLQFQLQLQQFQQQQFQQLLQLQQSQHGQQQVVQLPTVQQQVTTVVPNTGVQQPIITNPRPNNCNTIIQCTPGQRFDEATCQCVCIQQAQCRFRFQVFNPTTCQCEPNECPNTCSNCETQNSLTCECLSVITCPAGKALDSQTCQCICNNDIQCNALQQFNPVTCQCDCRSFTETVEQTIPSLGGRANSIIRIANPRPTSIETSGDRSNSNTHTHRGRTHSHRGGRHRHRGRNRRDSYKQDVAMYLNRQELLSRQKRVKETDSTGTRSQSGSRRSKSNSRRVAVTRQQEVINTITITRQVFACPTGKRSVLSTCTCI